MAFDESLIARLRDVVGEAGLILRPDAMEPYLTSWRDDWRGVSPAVVRPCSTDEVARVVRLCAETRTAIVPQGGRTGLTGAGQPHADGSEIVLSTDRLNRIRGVDPRNDTIEVEAGCVLAEVRAAAEAQDRLFPLSTGAAGSCQIGGTLSTNAGGIHVMRYGNARALVLGLEVVLPDGRVWNGLRALRKDNAGYDMKHLFIGAEGTLGIVTAAVLKLVARPRGSATALLAVSSPAAALRWLADARTRFAEQVTAAELIQRLCLEVACRRVPGVVDPLAQPYPWYLLVEVAGQRRDEDTREELTASLEAGLAAGELLDGTIASSIAQARALWAMREAIPEAHRQEGVSYKHDVAVPLSRIAEFLIRAEAALRAAMPELRMFSFGHLGDGNIHFNPLGGPSPPRPDDLERVNRVVHDAAAACGGSISAEHGIGRLRREELRRYRSATEIDMMRMLKRAFDPAGIMNPGKVLPEPE